MSNKYKNVGVMKVPAEFDYSDILAQGKPHHQKFDDFYRVHPFMSVSKRAKIFAPFSALKGFDGAISNKNIQYQPKIMLDENVINDINDTLSKLKRLTQNSRIAKQNGVKISVTYFVPCSDINHESYGYYGQYVTVKDIYAKIDDITNTITVGNLIISLDDIFSIEFVEE